MEENQADRLIKAGRLKIGWLSCPVRERNNVKRCFKCQPFGHIFKECSEEDRDGDCPRFGKKGHKIIEYPRENAEYCYNCQIVTSK